MFERPSRPLGAAVRVWLREGRGSEGGGLPQPFEEESCKMIKGKASKMLRTKTCNQKWACRTRVCM